jgi:hypothetical protein
MKTRRPLILLLILIANYMQLSSQNIESNNLRDSLFEFLISQGDFDKDMKSKEAILIINDIATLKPFEKQSNGIFKFGTLTSHSYFHILLCNDGDYLIINMKQPFENIIPKLLDYFQKNPLLSKKEVLCYMKRATELYLKNQDSIPWKLDE